MFEGEWMFRIINVANMMCTVKLRCTIPSLNNTHFKLTKFKFKFNEISSEAGQMASIPGYTIVSINTFQYTMI